MRPSDVETFVRHRHREPAPEALPQPMDERLLADQAAQGDRESFDRLVQRYLERTFHIALRMVGNREDAEDVTQEAFARAHRNLHQFQGRSTFGTWITSICVRLCLDLDRRRQRRPNVLPLDPEVNAPADRALEWREPPSAQLQHRETARRLEHCIGRLPRRLKTALVLRVLEGMEYQDVAQVMGTTVRSARIYVSEARRRLADLLEPGGGAS